MNGYRLEHDKRRTDSHLDHAPAQPTDRQVFISYSSSDKPIADQICAAIEAGGSRCWIAPRDIEPGADYPTAILSGLQQARAIVVVVSAAAVASPHILSEVGHAFDRKKPIISFRLSREPLPPNFDYFLSLSQWLDATQGATTQNLALVTEAVSQALSGRSIADLRKPAGLDKRLWIAGVIVLVVAAVAGSWLWLTRKSPALPPTAPVSTTNVKEPSGNVVKPAPPPEVATNAPAKPPPENKPRSWVNPKDGLTYVSIPPGSFTMGCSPGDTQCSPDESPSHLVEVPKGFWLGQTEVTSIAYRRIIPSAALSATEDKLPVVNITWREAKAYCRAVGGRLPTEAEWEYSARGGGSGAYYGIPSKIAWYATNSNGERHPTGTKQPNAYGLYDMLGNVSEWVLDRYYQKYDIESAAIGDVEQPLASNASATLRGGFWESDAQHIRVSRRNEAENDQPAPMAGIRCAIDRN